MTHAELDNLIQSKVYEQAQKYRPTNLAVALPWIATGILLIALVASHAIHVRTQNRLEAALVEQGKLSIAMSDKIDWTGELAESNQRSIGSLLEIVRLDRQIRE